MREASALADGGVDLFMLETFRDLAELNAAIRAVRSVSGLPIVAQITTEADGNGLDGTPQETFTAELGRSGADVIGVNCSVGPAAMLETIESMARLTSARLVAQPNRGRFEARRAGVELATGELVLLLDSRVVIAEDSLAFVADRIAQGERVWTSHVEITAGHNPYGTFWRLLAELAWEVQVSML